MPPDSSFGHLVARALEAHLAQAPHDDVLDLVLALVGVLAERERDVVVEVHRAEERAVLEQDAELLAHLEELVVGHRRHGLAVHEHVALVRIEQADHVLDADRLPGARRAEDHRDLVLGDAEVEAAQDLVAAERLVDVDELDRGVALGLALRAGVPAVLVVLAALRLAQGLGRGAARLRLLLPLPLTIGLRLRAALAADQRGVAVLCHCQPPMGARGFAPQKIWVPSMPMRWTSTMLSTIDFAVAVPTPTGPPDAL